LNKDIVEVQKQYIEKVNKLNGDTKKYYNILTMGCQLNENDSEKISGMLSEMGYEETDDLNKANIYILNTCCVRENAEERLFREAWRIKS